MAILTFDETLLNMKLFARDLGRSLCQVSYHNQECTATDQNEGTHGKTK